MNKEYTSDELNEFENMTDEVIIGIFNNQESSSRRWITIMLKRAFELGKDSHKKNE